MNRILAAVENVMRSKIVNKTSGEEIVDKKLKPRLQMKMNKLLVRFAMKIEQEGEGIVFLNIFNTTYKSLFLLTKKS